MIKPWVEDTTRFGIRGRTGRADSRVAGETLHEISRSAGISRERIRQITRMIDPAEPWNALVTERAALCAELAANSLDRKADS